MSRRVLPVSLYFKVWLALMALLVLTVGAYMLPLPGPFALLANLGIAVVKALLVMLIFMHVRDSGKLIWLTAGGAFYWLGILLVLSLSDFATRGWMPLPGK
jgi:cytochrome c oxidase subunit 4